LGRADALRRRIVEAVTRRGAYVASNGLDPSFCLPGANWGTNAANDYMCAYRHVRDGGYDVLNRLRLWAPVFSGYSLMRLSDQTRGASVEPIPPDHDQWLSENRRQPDQWAQCWLHFARLVAPQLRYSPPMMLGEIGWLIDGVVVNHDTYVRRASKVSSRIRPATGSNRRFAGARRFGVI